MIKKSIFVTFILFLAYNCSLLILSPFLERISIVQNQWQANTIKAQEYIYDKIDSRAVFVGTSLTFRLPSKSLPDYSFNLAFAGLSIIDGIDIIKRSHARPDFIFIEENLFLNKSDLGFSNTLFMPILYNFRKYIPALRERNQPLCYYFAFKGKFIKFFQTALHFLFRNKRPQNTSRVNISEKSQKHPEKTDPKILEERLKYLLATYDKVPNTAETNSGIHFLTEYLEYFKSLGIKVVFFEVPFNVKAYETNYVRHNESVFDNFFSSKGYLCIKYPTPNNLDTTDGLHLETESADIFAKYLDAEYKRLLVNSYESPSHIQ